MRHWAAVARLDKGLPQLPIGTNWTPAARSTPEPVAATRSELAAGLRFQRSGSTGFSHLTVTNGIARLRLTGACNSRGSTFTVATHIVETYKIVELDEDYFE